MLDEDRIEFLIRRESATGDRIARENARVRRYIVAKLPLAPSSGAPLARQLLNALRRPGPINVGRPVNEVGARSFHFSTTSCAKDSSSGSVAGAHQSYLERGGPDAAQNQQYLERGAPGGGPVVASFGNLGRTFEERLDFWNAVTSAEHAPASFAVASLHFDRGPEFWTEVGSDRAAPEALRAALASGSRKIVLRDVVSTALLMAYLTSFPATNKPPVVISPGRGGRIQTRVVAELPHEVSDETRRSIAEAFCNKMFGKTPGVRYWAVIHAPDEHNDARNYHLHIAFHDRPTRKIPDQTRRRVWDFELCELRHDKKNRNRRLRRPKRQNRDREFSRRNWPATARKQYAEVVNRALEDAGLTPRFDPRKYTEMGIDLDTIPRASAKAYSAEKRGVVTKAADRTIEAQWARYQANLGRQNDALTLPSDIEGRFDAAAAAAVLQHLPEFVTRQIATDRDAWKSAFRLKHSALAENAALEFNVRRMVSRAVPIIGASGAKTPQAEYLAALSGELRAPIDMTYRQAALHERRALEALARHEAEIALGREQVQPPTNVTRPLSIEDRLDRPTHVHDTARRQYAPQRQVGAALTLTDQLAADAAEALALQCACVSASLELALTVDADQQRRIGQVADQAIVEEPAPNPTDRDASTPDFAANTSLLNYTGRPGGVTLLEADRALTLTDELAADAAETLALQCACASASLDLALNAEADRQKRIARVADQAIEAEAAPRSVDRDASTSDISANTSLLNYVDCAGSVALLEADWALTLADELAADAAHALALQCACASASLGLALDAAANRQKRIAQVADQAIDVEGATRDVDRDTRAPDIAANSSLLNYTDRAGSVALLETDRALTLADELAADAAEALALRCAYASASLDLALTATAKRQMSIAEVADQAFDEERTPGTVDCDAPAPYFAVMATLPDCGGRADNLAPLEAVATLTDELAAEAADALALQCACASVSLDPALAAAANRQEWIAEVADQAVDEEPAEAIPGERTQSAVQIESTRVGATIPVELTPHKEKPDDGRNQPEAAEQFRRNESGIAGNDRAIPDSDRDDAQDAFFLPERADGTSRTTEEAPIDASARRDLGLAPSDPDSPQSPLEPDYGRSDRHSDKGEYRDLRDVSTIGGGRRAVPARPSEQATHEEAHLGLQNGSEIPAGFGDHGLQPTSASAGRADGSYGSADQPSPTSDELRDAELTRIRRRRDKLRGSADVGLRFSSIAGKIVGRYNKRYLQSALSALRRNTFANASDIQGYLTPIDECSRGHRRWIGAWMRELSDFRIQDKATPEPPLICVSMDPIIARRRRKAALPPSNLRPPSSSAKVKNETPGTIPVTARHRFTRPPPEEEAPAAAVPTPPVAHPVVAAHAAPRTDTTMGLTTSAATTRHPAENLADAKATSAPENRPAHVAQTGLDRVAPVAPTTVGATATTGSSAAAKPDSEKRVPPIKEGPIIRIGFRSPNYRRLQRQRPGPER